MSPLWAKCSRCQEAVDAGSTLTHVCRPENTWSSRPAELAADVPRAAQLNALNAFIHAVNQRPHRGAVVNSSSSSSTLSPPLETAAPAIAPASGTSSTSSLTPSTDPSTGNGSSSGNSETSVDSDDSSATIVPQGHNPPLDPIPLIRPAYLPHIFFTPTRAAPQSAPATSIGAWVRQNANNTRRGVNGTPGVNGSSVNNTTNPYANANANANASTSSLPATPPIIRPTPTRPPPTRPPPRTTRPRRPTESNHAFDSIPLVTEPFPDFVDTPDPNGTYINGDGTPPAPLPTAEQLARRRRRNEIHYSQEVRASIIEEVLGNNASGLTTTNTNHPSTTNNGLAISPLTHPSLYYHQASVNGEAFTNGYGNGYGDLGPDTATSSGSLTPTPERIAANTQTVTPEQTSSDEQTPTAEQDSTSAQAASDGQASSGDDPTASSTGAPSIY
ncbi:hypothetical protein FQN54_009076 [Arachnomyces sp. PD_36]|nr:hypothetical protein FQN54_009076 [Arachnomyces sp. PD_36]